MGQLETRRAAERAERDRRAVLAFFADFGAGRFEAARARTVDFSWFGRAITAAHWSGERLQRYVEVPTVAHGAREVPKDVVDRWLRADAERLLDGALADDDAVWLVDVDRDGATSTCGVIVAEDARLKRVFDPEPLRAALAAAN